MDANVLEAFQLTAGDGASSLPDDAAVYGGERSHGHLSAGLLVTASESGAASEINKALLFNCRERGSQFTAACHQSGRRDFHPPTPAGGRGAGGLSNFGGPV